MSVKKKKTISIDDLAMMINQGFNEVKESNANEHKDMGNRMNKMEYSMKKLEQGQEDIKVRLDNVPYRFELDALTKRVERLEKIDLINTSKLPK